MEDVKEVKPKRTKKQDVSLENVHLLFTVIRGISKEEKGFFYPAVYLVRDGKIVEKKIGKPELMHHALQIVNIQMADFLTEFSNDPQKFWDTIEL